MYLLKESCDMLRSVPFLLLKFGMLQVRENEFTAVPSLEGIWWA